MNIACMAVHIIVLVDNDYIMPRKKSFRAILLVIEMRNVSTSVTRSLEDGTTANHRSSAVVLLMLCSELATG